MSSRRGGLTLRSALALCVAALLLPCCTTNIGQGDVLSELTVRVSVDSNGDQVTAPTTANRFSDGMINPSISGDGRYVAFESTSSQFVVDDDNGFRNIIVKDRLTGLLENITFIPISTRVQRFAAFTQDNFNPCISGDGRFVAFESAGNYISGVQFSSTFHNIWVYDRVNQTFANATLNGNPGMNADCTNPKLSFDGRFVVWLSAATNVQSQVGGGTTYTIQNYPAPPYAPNIPATPQVYVTDLSMPAGDIIKLASHTLASNTQGCNTSCPYATISGDGSVVAFETAANDLVASGDTDTIEDVYLCTMSTLTVELVDLAVNPGNSMVEKANFGARNPALSFDGRYVSFVPTASNWGLVNPNFSLMRRDRTGGVTVLVTSDYNGAFPSMSSDGLRHCYVNTSQQVAYFDMLTGTSQTISVNISGLTDNKNPQLPSISADGLWIVWHSLGDNLVANDTNGINDVFVRGPLGP
jgi:hypothetical protein